MNIIPDVSKEMGFTCPVNNETSSPENKWTWRDFVLLYVLNILGLVQNVQYIKQDIEQKAPLFNVLFLCIEHSEKCPDCSMARFFNKWLRGYLEDMQGSPDAIYNDSENG